MLQRKKEIKRIFFTVLFVVTIFLSNVQILSSINVFQDDNIDNTFYEGFLEKIPLSSNINLDENITGSGVDQDVRIYVNNKSENRNNNQEYFEIPTLSSEDMFLTYGDFNITFQNNFTTDYIIENDTALFVDQFISFDFDTNPNYSNITFHNGTLLPPSTWVDVPDDFFDGSNSTYIHLNATQGLLNFTVTANYTDTTRDLGPLNGYVDFDRSRILGLILSFVYEINNHANLTVKILDYSQSTWIDILTAVPVNSSIGIQDLRKRLINENLNFIDLSDSCHLQFIFERYDQTAFEAWLYNIDLDATYAFDLPITNQNYVALEFDLKGEKSTVNGFYAWIRTLNLTAAATTQLNITLYRANDTVVRDDDKLRNINLGPDYNDLINTKSVSYTGDNISYFEFDISKTKNLNLSNYFIVIKSDNPIEVYSLVALPYFNYGDEGDTEHQLKTTVDDGSNWINAHREIPASILPYASGQLDASSFKLNVTRGYKPSDFKVNNNRTLKIQDLPIEDVIIKYNDSSYLEWGKGRWNHNFSTPIDDIPANKFRVDLTWNKTNIDGFEFNVSYSANAYWIESASTTYSVNFDTDPEWLFTYNLTKGDPKFDEWNFLEFWYVYSDFLTAHNLTNPNNQQILSQTGGQSILSENPYRYKVVVQNNLATLNGFYSLNLTSFNFISKMQSYINFNDILWESNGFMNGDNISISVEIQDHHFNAPISGIANVSLFYPNGSLFDTPEQTDSVGSIEGSSLVYDFNNQTILDLTNNVKVFGEYHLGFFWFNGSAIGCKKIVIYIDVYDAELYGCDYNPTLKKNLVNGQIFEIGYDNFTLLIASINDTTGISQPDFYPISNENVNTQFSRIIEDEELPILLTSFRQNESILNPSEIIKIKAAFENLHQFLNVSVKINVKVVSYINEEWIITENISNTIELKFSGHPNDANEFDIDLKIPDLNNVTNVWEGENAPVRLGGAKTQITIFIDDVNVGMYESADISLLSNETNTNYDGYILGLRINEETTTETILNQFNRDECIYLPDNTSFLINIIDKNYVSSYKQFTGEFSLKLNSEFANITINPDTPIKGQSFNISATLATEFGEKLVIKNISCQYYDINSWVNLVSDFTDSSGFIEFLIDTLLIDFEGDLLLRLLWDGNSINGVSKNVTVSIIHEKNDISISIIPNSVQIYRNRASTFTIVLDNIGDSNLKVNNISIELNQGLSYSVVEIDYILLNFLPPNERTHLIVEIPVGDINRLDISVFITAENIITSENVTVTENASFTTYDPPIFDYLIKYFIFIIGAALALVWVIAIVYSRRTKKKLETPIEEVKKKPRRGRYVPVTELKKPEPVKKVPKKKEESKEVEEKKKMDLDSLLEERGLADKKKKPKE